MMSHVRGGGGRRSAVARDAVTECRGKSPSARADTRNTEAAAGTAFVAVVVPVVVTARSAAA